MLYNKKLYVKWGIQCKRIITYEIYFRESAILVLNYN